MFSSQIYTGRCTRFYVHTKSPLLLQQHLKVYRSFVRVWHSLKIICHPNWLVGMQLVVPNLHWHPNMWAIHGRHQNMFLPSKQARTPSPKSKKNWRRHDFPSFFLRKEIQHLRFFPPVLRIRCFQVIFGSSSFICMVMWSELLSLAGRRDKSAGRPKLWKKTETVSNLFYFHSKFGDDSHFD